jgi:acyl carrier protein
MTRPELEEAVRTAAQNVLKTKLAKGADLKRGDAGWDSIKHVELVSTVEGAVGVQFDAEELGELDSLAAIAAAAEKHLAAG